MPPINFAIFKNDKPPPGYIPGVGRGAVGFVTRSDIGPASEVPECAAREGEGLPRGRCVTAG
jgi:hypothetical protein